MKVTFFRILSILILTISCFTTSANAQYSVCCPASDADCELPENQCHDYLEATADQPSVQNWLDRVSNTLRNADSNHAEASPVKTAPDSATPIDFDIVSRGPCGGFSPNAAAAEKAAEQIEKSNQPHASKLIILREDCPVQAFAPQIDADVNLLIESLTKRNSTWSLVSHLQKQAAQSMSYWDAVKDIDYSANMYRAVIREEVSYWDIVKDIDYSANIAGEAISEKISYWDAVKDIDYSANMSRAVIGEAVSYWDIVKDIDYSANIAGEAISAEISYWDAVKDADYSGNVSAIKNPLKADNRIASNPQPNYSQYDLYNLEAIYLYGCFGYESIYGKDSSESVAEVIVPQSEPAASEAGEVLVKETTESSSETQPSRVPFGAELDGYLPYDIDENAIDSDDPFEAASIELIQKRAEVGEAIEQNSQAEISCPFEHDSIKHLADFPFTLDELTLLPGLLQTYANRIVAAWQQWNVVDSVWQINNRIEMTLCGSESLTVWRDAIWAHEKSLEVTRELEIVELRREKILSIAQTLDLLGNQLKAASAKLITLAEIESHKLIGRRASASLNR